MAALNLQNITAGVPLYRSILLKFTFVLIRLVIFINWWNAAKVVLSVYNGEKMSEHNFFLHSWFLTLNVFLVLYIFAKAL